MSRKRYPGDIVTDGIVPERKKKKDWVSHKDLQNLKRIAYGATEASVLKKPSTELHDPWAEPEPIEQNPELSWLEKTPEIKVPVTLKMGPVSLSATGKPLPAVKIPEGGISYNPRFEEWDELLRKEGDKEVEAEKKRLNEAQEERERLARLEKQEAEELVKELAEAGKAEEEEVDEEADDGEKETFDRKRAVRKTKVQRNKEKRRKEHELLKARLLQQKKQRQELENLRAIKRQIEAEENAKLEALLVAADEEGGSEKAGKLRRRQLGKAQYALLSFFKFP